VVVIAAGKYRDWLTEDGLARIEQWAREGMTDEKIARKMGINPATLYKWQNSYGEISEALKKGKAPVDIQVENALLKRALGYDYEEVMTEVVEMPDGSKRRHIKKTTKQVVPDVTAQIYWLNNRRPDRWRAKQRADATDAMSRLDQLLEEAKRAAYAETG
jgi:transposase-like protein